MRKTSMRGTDSKIYYKEEETVLRRFACQAQIKSHLHRVAARKFSIQYVIFTRQHDTQAAGNCRLCAR